MHTKFRTRKRRVGRDISQTFDGTVFSSLGCCKPRTVSRNVRHISAGPNNEGTRRLKLSHEEGGTSCTTGVGGGGIIARGGRLPCDVAIFPRTETWTLRLRLYISAPGQRACRYFDIKSVANLTGGRLSNRGSMPDIFTRRLVRHIHNNLTAQRNGLIVAFDATVLL